MKKEKKQSVLEILTTDLRGLANPVLVDMRRNGEKKLDGIYLHMSVNMPGGSDWGFFITSGKATKLVYNTYKFKLYCVDSKGRECFCKTGVININPLCNWEGMRGKWC